MLAFRVGYRIAPPANADYLNTHSDAYPLARTAQAAAVATLQHEEQIRERVIQLSNQMRRSTSREWTVEDVNNQALTSF